MSLLTISMRACLRSVMDRLEINQQILARESGTAHPAARLRGGPRARAAITRLSGSTCSASRMFTNQQIASRMSPRGGLPRFCRATATKQGAYA